MQREDRAPNLFFDTARNDGRDVIRRELAYTSEGVCSQRLLKRTGGGRIPCIELPLCTLPMVRDAILEGDIQRLYNIIEVDSEMKSFRRRGLHPRHHRHQGRRRPQAPEITIDRVR